MGSVNITLANGQLGSQAATSDGVAGMVLTGQSESGGYTVGTPILVTSLSNLGAQGISATNNAFAYRQVKEFYDEAANGSQLYLMLLPTTSVVSAMADHTNADGAKKLLDFAAGKVKLLGIMTDDAAIATLTGSPVATTHAINDDVLAAASNMAILAQNYFEAEQPFRAIIGGTSYTGSAATLSDMTAGTTNNRTAILLGDSQGGAGACLGLALGRLATIPVQRKISRVRTGPLTMLAAFIGTATVEAAAGDVSTIASKGYITLKTFPNISGYYFTGDDTCSALTEDYHFLARGRVIDKAHVLAYTTFVQEVDDEVPVNEDGTLDAGFCKWLGQQIINQVTLNMVANKEVSSVECFIDPTQNIISTNQLNVVLKITPVGYASDIEISLGFENPAA